MNAVFALYAIFNCMFAHLSINQWTHFLFLEYKNKGGMAPVFHSTLHELHSPAKICTVLKEKEEDR